MKKIKIERTKKGFPCMWEKGGGYTNTGESTIIADIDGRPKKAIYIRQRGELANAEHALIPVEIGDYVIETDHHREDFNITVYRINSIYDVKIPNNGNIVEERESFPEFESYPLVTELKPIAKFSNGEWDNENISKVFHAWETGNLESIIDIDDDIYNLCQAILTAKQKATCYHCREPHFIEDIETKASISC